MAFFPKPACLKFQSSVRREEMSQTPFLSFPSEIHGSPPGLLIKCFWSCTFFSWLTHSFTEQKFLLLINDLNWPKIITQNDELTPYRIYIGAHKKSESGISTFMILLWSNSIHLANRQPWSVMASWTTWIDIKLTYKAKFFRALYLPERRCHVLESLKKFVHIHVQKCANVLFLVLKELFLCRFFWTLFALHALEFHSALGKDARGSSHQPSCVKCSILYLRPKPLTVQRTGSK